MLFSALTPYDISYLPPPKIEQAIIELRQEVCTHKGTIADQRIKIEELKEYVSQNDRAILRDARKKLTPGQPIEANGEVLDALQAANEQLEKNRITICQLQNRLGASHAENAKLKNDVLKQPEDVSTELVQCKADLLSSNLVTDALYDQLADKNTEQERLNFVVKALIEQGQNNLEHLRQLRQQKKDLQRNDAVMDGIFIAEYKENVGWSGAACVPRTVEPVDPIAVGG